MSSRHCKDPRALLLCMRQKCSGERQSALGWTNDSPQGQSHGHLVGIGVLRSAVFSGEGSEEKDLHGLRQKESVNLHLGTHLGL